MNILQKIKVLFSMKSTAEEVYKEAQMPTVTGKPGWKTSTFWVKILTVDVPVLYMGLKGFLPPDVAVKIEVVAMGLYAVYRAISETVTKVQAVKLANGPAVSGEVATATATVGTSAA